MSNDRGQPCLAPKKVNSHRRRRSNVACSLKTHQNKHLYVRRLTFEDHFGASAWCEYGGLVNGQTTTPSLRMSNLQVDEWRRKDVEQAKRCDPECDEARVMLESPHTIEPRAPARSDTASEGLRVCLVTVCGVEECFSLVPQGRCLPPRTGSLGRRHGLLKRESLRRALPAGCDFRPGIGESTRPHR